MNSELKELIYTFLPDNGKYLEIGPGLDPVIEGADTTDPNMTNYKGDPITVDFRTRIECLGFVDNSYDAIYFGDVLEHVTNPIKGLKECRRVLKNGGRLIAIIPDRNCTYDKHRQVTTLFHVIQDYENDVSSIDDTHWDEWVAVLESEGELSRIDDKDRQIANGWIHHHCWDQVAVFRLFDEVFTNDSILLIQSGLDNNKDKILCVVEITK